MPSQMGLMDLARHLRQEYLFVSSERQNIQHLNEKVLKTVEHLYHLSWIARQQRANLDNLTLLHKDDNPVGYCQRASVFETVNFIDSYKQLGVNDSMYADFLQQVRENPKLLATCLNAGEHINITTMHNAVNIIMAALYGNCIVPEDEFFVLNLLKELMSLQLAISDNPRRLLRHGSCAFSRVYKTFNECLFSAKIFLTAALYEPIMHVLMEDDLFLDIDPSKAAVRFHPHERLRHFGKEGTQEYAANLQRHRTWIINKLFTLTMHFIDGIRNNLCCFPQSLSWLARQMYNSVMKAKRVEVREVGAMCADLVFAFFICPAIVNPVPYGITDIHISDIARFNLMQVAQILQVLAMSKWEEIDPKLMDLYGKFEKDSMSSLLDLILEGSTTESETNWTNQSQELNRSAILITESELMSLLTFLRTIEHDTDDNVLKKLLFSLISHLPVPSINIPSLMQNGEPIASTPIVQLNESHSLLTSKKSFLGKVAKRGTRSQSNSITNSESNLEDSCSLNESENSSASKAPLEDVLVVPIPGMEIDCPGLLNEDKVLAAEYQKRNQACMGDGVNGDENDSITGSTEIVEKRTRFSLSQDQESVGTSDNLEAISEAASNHSVASSVDLENENYENENDNLSDMVSANVSGRGTPNVSGRDTPSSQLEGEEREQRPLDLVNGPRKQNQENIEDKFGKFEIQPLMEGDETKSMVSDTWSTDVLASDSETVEQSECIPPQATLESQNLNVLDASETASQSDAWSTDVLASDTERLLDVDTDDTASVARSDDTGRSEADGEVPQGLDITPMDSKDFMELEHAESAADYRMMSQMHSTNFPVESPKIRLRGLRNDIGDEGEFSLFPEKKHTKVTGSQKNFSSCQDSYKLVDALCPEAENLIQLDCAENQQSLNEDLSSMQSLGRVSLVVRELPDAEDQDSGSLLLDSLQETVNISMQNERSSHRSSIADILSLDLTRTLNLHTSELISQEDVMRKSESSTSLMEIEREILGGNLLRDKPLNTEFKKVENFPEITLHGERGAKRKLLDSVFTDESNARLSAASVSSTTSSTGSEKSANVKVSNNDLTDQCNGDVEMQPKVNSSPPSMGAIPKSISFDKAVPNMDQQNSEEKFGNDKSKKGLFKLSSFKFTFKGRNRKSHLPYRADASFKGDESGIGVKNFRGSQSSFAEIRALQLEAGDEILAKYRKKSPSMGSSTVAKTVDSLELSSCSTENILMDNGSQVFDGISIDTSLAFYNAKRKLRLVLGSSDLQTLPWQTATRPSIGSQRLQDNELVAFLKVLLAEAINLQLRPLLSHLREALRCVQMFDDVGCQKLFKSLRDDYKKRAPYISYLVRCRQGLLSSLSHLETLIERVQRDKQVCNHNLVMLCVKLFLEKQERPRQVFLRKFVELTVADEKAMLVQNFLTFLFNRLESDSLWQTANENQIEHAQVVIERAVMGQIYTSALHPNGDGDLLRDKVLQEHMQKLSQVITPNHKDLRIPKQYHSECPWPSAQAELDLINAYKTPRDKIQCVVRCCSTIMNLLSMASDKQVPAADDLMPVLVFVLIKANPSNMLSTVQYVNTFYEKQLEGEEAYWWTQFCCAVEFVKTMDY